MDSSVLDYVKTFKNANPTFGYVQNYNVNRWGEGNMAPMKTFNYGGKTYYLAPTQKMYVGKGGWDRISDTAWSQGQDVSIGRLKNQNFRLFDFDPFSQGHNITPGESGGSLLKAIANFLPIAAAVIAPPLLAGLGGGAAAGAGGGASAAAPTTGVGSTGAGIGGAGGAGGVAAAGGGGGSAAGGVAGTSLLPSGSAYGGSLGLTMPAAGAATGSGITAGGTGLGLSAPLAGGGTLTAGGAGAVGGIGGFLNSIGQALGGLSGSQVLQGGLGLGDLAMRLWQQNELGNIANEAASRSDPMNQPQRFPYQQLANQYATGGQNIMTQPMVKAAYDLGMNDVMAKTAKFSDSGQAWKAIADNSNKTFQSSALPYLDWLGTMGGFKQGPGYAGNLYGQYASQATGAPFLGINSLVSGFNANNNANTGVNNYFADFFKDYQRASRTPSWNASLYTQA